jgi:sortase A
MKARVTFVFAAFIVALVGITLMMLGPAAEKPLAEPADEPGLFVTIPEIGVDHVRAHYGPADDEYGMKQGLLHVKGTGFPWQRGANVYIAGHDLGFPGTDSDHIFWNLQKLDPGDEFTIEDSNGVVYRYRVYKTFTIEPSETWVMQPVEGRNVATLQTCRPHGEWTHRLIVRAELVEVS